MNGTNALVYSNNRTAKQTRRARGGAGRVYAYLTMANRVTTHIVSAVWKFSQNAYCNATWG